MVEDTPICRFLKTEPPKPQMWTLWYLSLFLCNRGCSLPSQPCYAWYLQSFHRTKPAHRSPHTLPSDAKNHQPQCPKLQPPNLQRRRDAGNHSPHPQACPPFLSFSSNSLINLTKVFLCTNPANWPSLNTHIYLKPSLTKH